jgi:homoserine kinase type II
MSVFTVVEAHELSEFLRSYDVGDLQHYAGIEAGIENTNYFVTTTAGAYVLTLFEITPAADLGYFLALMAHLATRDIASAAPIANRSGSYLEHLKGKPAALVQRVSGSSVIQPQARHCEAIGDALARLHLAARDQTLLEAVFDEPDIDRNPALAGGVIHADLFRDNALFEAFELTGIIDFYYARSGPFIYDLAVTVADWCYVSSAAFNADLARVMLQAYHRVRPLDAAEHLAWPGAIRSACARFWLSRMKDAYFPRAGTLTYVKDPAPFGALLLFALKHPQRLLEVWP